MIKQLGTGRGVPASGMCVEAGWEVVTRGRGMVAMRQVEGQNQHSLSHSPRTGQDPPSGTLAPDWVVATDATCKTCLLGGGLCRERVG